MERRLCDERDGEDDGVADGVDPGNDVVHHGGLDVLAVQALVLQELLYDALGLRPAGVNVIKLFPSSLTSRPNKLECL